MNVLSLESPEKVEEDQGNALIAVKKDMVQGIVHNLESLEKVVIGLINVSIVEKKDTCLMNVRSHRNLEQRNALIVVKKDILQGNVHSHESLEKGL